MFFHWLLWGTSGEENNYPHSRNLYNPLPKHDETNLLLLQGSAVVKVCMGVCVCDSALFTVRDVSLITLHHCCSQIPTSKN